jgi:peptidoglycan/xylan/chitin deacetylase (PgdA/CDA1 family)
MRDNVMSRRLVLAAGGLTLLAGCTNAAETLTQTAQTTPRRSPVPRNPAVPGARPDTRPGATPPAEDLSRYLNRPEFTIQEGQKAIALTIDDGPSLTYTPQVLQLLQRYNVTATFSMVGRLVAQHPGIAREVSAAGHQVSNHTWRHRDLQAMAPSAAIDEIDRATDAIQTEVGITPRYFRAPYGAWTKAVLRRCVQHGMLPLDWSVDPTDWARPGTSYIVSNILRHTRTGSIILEHDGGGDRSQTVAALKVVIPSLLDSGYHFTTP